MALKLAKTLRNGSTAEYWKLSTNFMYDVLGQALQTTITLYVNADTRNSNKQNVSPHELENWNNEIPHYITLTGETALTALQTGDPRAAFYNYLKTLDFFAGAEDV